MVTLHSAVTTARRDPHAQPPKGLIKPSDEEPVEADGQSSSPQQLHPSPLTPRQSQELVADLLFEHTYLARILNAFEDQIVALRNHKQVDYGLMQEIMHYVVHYPDVYHHPCEHVLFERLRRHDPLLRSVVERLEHEHTLGYEEGRRLLALLASAHERPTPKLRAEILRRGERYIAGMRQHMQREETDVFAKAVTLLTAEDCAVIEGRRAMGDDPLISESGAFHYPGLIGYFEETVRAVYTDVSWFQFLQGLAMLDSLTELWVGANQVLGIVKEDARKTYSRNLDYGKAALRIHSAGELWQLSAQALNDNWRRQQDTVRDLAKVCWDTAHSAMQPFKDQLSRAVKPKTD